VPKIQWENFPREKWAHWRDRAKERRVSMADLFELANWKSQDPDMPDGDWYKDLRTLNSVGRVASQALPDVSGQPARGKRL